MQAIVKYNSMSSEWLLLYRMEGRTMAKPRPLLKLYAGDVIPCKSMSPFHPVAPVQPCGHLMLSPPE